MPSRPLPQAIYTPLPTFFDKNENIDLEALRKHVVFTASEGTIPVLAGSMGEAVHLSRDERRIITQTARSALDEAGLHKVVLVAGVGAPSTRETIILANDAAEAGANFVMVIPSGYYAGGLQADGMAALKAFYVDIAAASTVPVILYNFPAVSAGIDMSSDFILDVLRATPNVVGAKLTCASVGKITRITAVAHGPDFMAKYPRVDPHQKFEVIDGFIDILLPSVAVGAGGAISGLPNFAPRVCVRLWELCNSRRKEDQAEARRLQGLIALADGVAAGVGVAGMKQILHRRFGYGQKPRRPLLPMSEQKADELLNNHYIESLVAEERRLGGNVGA
ncbi:hypothetical protein BAUCODRAFT_150164 [Baudoinia panamericana UAMH 10762]|uniref:Dihydrodipicolinate synthase n=1 Tax=Baudoinia panamericana (strain UAMH 10762) TaxID=717646 RepID=M2N4I9_BAUPA|nr:uncharacterized protein BAUCODRAFT_150164 [Baudoinia panamericana UAMH 10762]EMC93929.1 hypothetical protein BAUCODRAFT_150164 [Baudoinia panamericana UAMH 10762]